MVNKGTYASVTQHFKQHGSEHRARLEGGIKVRI
jgi:hypothetical protein